MQNPLSIWTYTKRHKRRVSLMIGLISLMTVGIYLLMGLSTSVFDQLEAIHSYLTRFSVVSPAIEQTLDPEVISRIESHPEVAFAIPENGIRLRVGTLTLQTSFPLLGIRATDVETIMTQTGAVLKEGSLPTPGSNEIALPVDIAANLELSVGDKIGREIDEEKYASVPTTLELVGVLSGDVNLGLMSFEYLENHAAYAERSTNLVVFANAGSKTAVDDFLAKEVLSNQTDVQSYQIYFDEIAKGQRSIFLIFGIVDVMVAVVMTIVIGIINQMAFSQRLPEFGFLHALGFTKKKLVRRLFVETAINSILGLVIGLLLSWIIFYQLQVNVYAPQGMVFPIIKPITILFVLPIPIAVILFTMASIRRIFASFDAVAIVERGELSIETSGQNRRVVTSDNNPFSSITYYKRHKRRAVLLSGTMSITIMAVALMVILFAPSLEAEKPMSGYLSQLDVVFSQTEVALDPETIARIQSHAAVARVIPDKFLMLSVDIPPFSNTDIFVHAVSETDLAFLVNLYGLKLKEGRLPRPNTNQIAITEGIAQNRDLKVGDLVGRPVAERDENLPTEMIISGIFNSPALHASILERANSRDVWLAVASLEFVENHELYTNTPEHLLVVPQPGSKTALDDWLENEIASDNTEVLTDRQLQAQIKEIIRSVLILISTIETIVAVVAAAAISVLIYIFIAQRRVEFGVLYALGYSRLQLILRTTRETAFVTLLAWILSAGVSLAILILIHSLMYAPKGLPVNFLDPTPWLFTFPIPITVLLVSSSTVAWMLFRLDAVSIIERR